MCVCVCVCVRVSAEQASSSRSVPGWEQRCTTGGTQCLHAHRCMHMQCSHSHRHMRMQCFVLITRTLYDVSCPLAMHGATQAVPTIHSWPVDARVCVCVCVCVFLAQVVDPDRSGRTDGASGTGRTPYAQQLANLEAKYKRNSEAGSEAGDKTRRSLNGAAASSSGKLKVDPALLRSSSQQARGSHSGNDAATAAKSAAQDVLKQTLLAQVTDDACDPGSPTTARLKEALPLGDPISPTVPTSKEKKSAKKSPSQKGSNRDPMQLDADKMAVMASFGAGVAPKAAASAAASADAPDSKSGDDNFDFGQKRRAEMEAKLSAIEKRNGAGAEGGGKAGELGGKTKDSASGKQLPQPPADPPSRSPRTSIAAVRKSTTSAPGDDE